MKEWTFLLQKYGDRSWLPLDSPDMEILEGRYRIVVQTDHPNTDINVRVCHLATEEDPPKRRIQKRTNRTNSNGLMVVAPFTQLQAGNWELCCVLSDPMSDLIGDMLHHAVRLRVSPYLEPGSDDWDDDAPAIAADDSVKFATHLPDSETSADTASDGEAEPAEPLPLVKDMAALNVEIAQALGVSMDRLVEMTDQLSHQLIEEIFQEFNLSPTVEAAAIASPTAEPPTSESDTLPTPEVTPAVTPSLDVNQLRIVLAQEGWMAKRGESLAIAGRIELTPQDTADEKSALSGGVPDPNLEPELEGAIAQELQIQFRDPQSSKVLFHACQSFPAATPPMPFTFLCNLPDELTTHLLLGEVIIAGVLPGAESVLMTLKTLNFTVTVDPQGLVAEFQKVQSALAEKAAQDELSEVVAQFSERLQKEKERQSLDLSFLNMAAPVPESMMQGESAAIATETPTQPTRRKQILPPLLHQPDAEQAGKRKLELPMFAGVGASAVGATSKAEILSDAVEAPEAIFGDSDVDVQSMVLPDLPQPSHSFNLNTAATAAIASEDNDSTSAQFGEADNSAPSAPPSPPDKDADGQADLARIEELSSPIRTAFQALNLQDKFLTRLSSMAADAELTTLLKLSLPHSEPPDAETEKVAVAVDSKPIADLTTEPASTEVVVDDDASWQEWVKRAGSRPKPLEPRQEENGVNPLVLPADHAVPIPQLELGIDEIVAGKPINIRVKLPNLLPKIYVKLWVNDRQTRTLLDGPRWLVDFLPNGFDELEASTQITAPFDSMNIRLEAIAVEMQTQRESQKVSLDCEVIPADLPDELFDFEGF